MTLTAAAVIFGMVGLARTQTAVLNVVLTPTPDDGRPPCVLDLSFVDASGHVFRSAAGLDVAKRVTLRRNVADSLALRWQDVVPAGQLRAPIRAVAAPTPDGGNQAGCTGLAVSLEIVDALGFTHVLYQPTPDDGIPTPDDGLH
jgi:hypothetical protein